MVTLSSELLFLVLWISLLLDRGYLCRNWVYCCILFQEPCIFATRVISQCSLFISSWQTFWPCKLKKDERVRNLVALTLQVPRVFNIYNQGKGCFDNKLCYHVKARFHQRWSRRRDQTDAVTCTIKMVFFYQSVKRHIQNMDPSPCR